MDRKHSWILFKMKVLLVINIVALIILGTAQTCRAPRGNTFTLIRVTETEAGTRTEMVRYWREVSR